MTDEENGRRAVEHHRLGSDFGLTKVLITSVDRSLRLTQRASKHMHSWLKTWNTQIQFCRKKTGRIGEELHRVGMYLLHIFS